ncbi:MAG: hypothetical protein H6659_11015, partial [Ardenticatenaceae bacterium]|nr:hypothetical protein [Ardenticatenaceae bacterium]
MDYKEYDLKNIITKNRLVGLWRVMTGFHGLYGLAILTIGLAALMRSAIYYTLGYYVDNV